MTPQQFEQQVARIVETLSTVDGETRVTWNARIPDPDNPTQLRQIDIAIRRHGELTMVECRHRMAPEDVQWIEELYGRRESLGAISVIAVSSSGFTRGAIAKAERLGVFLRTLSQVSPQDVMAWGTRTKVNIVFSQLRRIHLALVVSDSIALPTPLTALRTDKGAPPPFPELIASLARRLNESNVPEGPATVELKLNRIFLGMTPVTEALISFEWHRIRREVALPVLLAYQRLNLRRDAPDALVEKSHHSATEIHHAETGGVAVIDLGALPFDECCTLVGAEVVFSQPTILRGVGLIGPSERLELIHWQLSAITRDDSRYRRILNSPGFVDLGTQEPSVKK